MTLKPNTIYLCDNGAAYCGEHCGSTAQATGRDISGQRIYAVTPEDARDTRGGLDFGCKAHGCEKTASL